MIPKIIFLMQFAIMGSTFAHGQITHDLDSIVNSIKIKNIIFTGCEQFYPENVYPAYVDKTAILNGSDTILFFLKTNRHGDDEILLSSIADSSLFQTDNCYKHFVANLNVSKAYNYHQKTRCIGITDQVGTDVVDAWKNMPVRLDTCVVFSNGKHDIFLAIWKPVQTVGSGAFRRSYTIFLFNKNRDLVNSFSFVNKIHYSEFIGHFNQDDLVDLLILENSEVGLEIFKLYSINKKGRLVSGTIDQVASDYLKIRMKDQL